MSSSKRHFTTVIGKKEQGTYISSSPSSAARKAVSKLCADNKNKKIKFSIRETTRDSNKKVYGPYIGYMQKLDKPVELEGRIIKYKPVAKLDKKGRKNKDFILKTKIKQKGGMNCVNERVFKNILGTCWMISIQMMMCFGDATKEQFERELAQSNTTNKSISNLDKILIKNFPSKYVEFETTERIRHLSILLNAFITRYIAKIERHIPVSNTPKKNPKRCELVIEQSFRLLFQKLLNIENIGGDNLDIYFFANLLGIFFLEQEIYFSMHTRKMFNKIRFDEQDIGIKIDIEEHACCFFICGGVPKFYNDHDKKINDFNFMDLLSNLKDDEDLFVIPNQVVALNRTEYFENIENYTEYKRIQLLTVVSKKNFGNNFNQEIKLFFDEEYDRINNFFLLFKVAEKFLDEDNKERYLHFLNKGLNYEYYATMYFLGLYYVEERQDINTAIKFYQKALDNGYNEAAEKLADLYFIERDKNNFKNFFNILLAATFWSSMATLWSSTPR
jgi:ribosomal protein L7Ae-like RNA K-turn-binding protein